MKEEELSEITVHPNPAANFIIVNTPTRSNVSIYNINGQLMTKKNVVAGEHRFDVSHVYEERLHREERNSERYEVYPFHY